VTERSVIMKGGGIKLSLCVLMYLEGGILVIRNSIKKYK